MNLRKVLMLAIVLSMVGCASIPEEAYRLPESSVSDREIQSRTFEVEDESQIIGASVAVLQDMGYNLDVIERPLGVLTASKVVDADSDLEKAGLIAAEVGLTVASILSGTMPEYYGVYATAEDEVHLELSLIVLPSLSQENAYIARITIQETLLNKAGQIKKQGVINEPVVYQEIFEKLSNSIFLESEDL